MAARFAWRIFAEARVAVRKLVPKAMVASAIGASVVWTQGISALASSANAKPRVDTASPILTSQLEPDALHELVPILRHLSQSPSPSAIISAMEHAAACGSGDSKRLVKRIFNTKSHQDILRFMVDHTRSLASGRWVGFNGPPTRNLQGPKGIGKTTMMRDWVAVCEAVFPGVIGLYITCEGISGNSHPLANQSLIEFIASHLRSRGVDVPVELGGDTTVAVIEALEKADRFVMLYVDEIEELYRIAPTDTERFKLANEILGNLQKMGTQSTGRFGVLLCGSSAVTPLLINGNASDLSAEFPRVVGAPNLNGTKFREKRIDSALPTDVMLVHDILSVYLNQPVTLQQARITTFMAGTAARNVVAIAETGPETRVLQESMTGARTLRSDQGILYRALLRRMISDNSALLTKICPNMRLDPIAIANSDWDKQFKPLSWHAVEEEWSRLLTDGLVDRRDAVLTNLIYALCDKGWLLYDDINACAPKNVYPSAVIDVVREHLGNDAVREVFATWDIFAPGPSRRMGP